MKHNTIKLLFAALIVSGPIYGAQTMNAWDAHVAEEESLSPVAKELLSAIQKGDKEGAQRACAAGAYISCEDSTTTLDNGQLPMHHIGTRLAIVSIPELALIGMKSISQDELIKKAVFELETLVCKEINRLSNDPERKRALDSVTLRSIGLCMANLDLQSQKNSSIEDVGNRLGDMFTFFGRLAGVNTQ